MRFTDLEGIASELADKLTKNERTFLSEMTRGSKYRPSDIVCIGFAKTNGDGEADRFYGEIFLTSRGEAEWNHMTDTPLNFFEDDSISDMSEDEPICYNQDIEHVERKISRLGNPSPRFINLGSKKNPYVLALYVRQPEGQVNFKEFL